MKEEITAKWARETAQNVLNERVVGQINKANLRIEQAVKENKFSANFYGELHDFAQKDIKDRGFGLEKNTGHQMDGESYTITW